MEKTWTNISGEVVAKIEIDDGQGISMQVSKDSPADHTKEIEELLTLNMYPPRVEDKVSGEVSSDGKWMIYQTKPGTNWEFAKKDIVSTFNYWYSGTLPEL